jgi:hypothetical protein
MLWPVLKNGTVLIITVAVPTMAPNVAYQRRAKRVRWMRLFAHGSPGNGRETKYAGAPRSFLDVPAPQCSTNLIKLACVSEREIRRPAVALLDEIDVHLSGILALADELGVTLGAHGNLRR